MSLSGRVPQRQRLRRCLIFFWKLLAIALVPLVTACSSDGPKRGAVRGEVTIDGAPLKLGSILFIPATGTAG